MNNIFYPKNTKVTTWDKRNKEKKKKTSKNIKEKEKEQNIQKNKKEEIKLKDVNYEIPKAKKDSDEKIQLSKEILSNNTEDLNSEEKEELYNNIKQEIEYDKTEC